MSNLSDKEIDRLSREAADSYEPDSSSLSWSRLEQKLKEQMPERPPDGFRFGRMNPYVWGPAVVFIAGVSFFLVKNIIYSQHSTRTNQAVNQSIPSASADTKQAGGNTLQPDSISSSVSAKAADSKNTPVLKQQNTPAGTSVQGKKASSLHVPASADNQSGSNSDGGGVPVKGSGIRADQSGIVSNTQGGPGNSAKKGSAEKAIISSSLAAGATLASDAKPPGDNDKASESQISNDGNSGSDEQASANVNVPDAAMRKSGFALPVIISSDANPVKVTQNDSLLNKIPKSVVPAPYKSVHINRSLNFGFAFGPDYTDAGGITNDQLGNNIGITVGYYLTNKLSVNTGIFYSNKFYWSPGHGIPNRGASYGTAGTNAAPPAIEYVNGACNMYELPLTLRYDFAHDEKTKFFVNAGLSSYFMVKQTYINFFHSNRMPVAYKTVDEEQLNYWFDVAAFSFGLETEIGKGFSFQAEPFFRLPLKDMGMQNLKLNTYGIMLSFRYTPVLSRSKK